MKSLFFSLLICFLLSQAYVRGATVKTLTLGTEETINQDEVSGSFLIADFDYTAENYLMITTNPTSTINPAHFYLSQSTSEPSPTQYEFSSTRIGINTIYIPTSGLQKQKEISITTMCTKTPCEYKILAQLITGNKILNVGVDLFLSRPEEVETIEIKKTLPVTLGRTMVYFYGDPADDLSTVKMTYSTDGTEFKDASPSLDGQSFNVDIATVSEEGSLIIKITGLSVSKQITVGARFIDQEIPIKPYEYTHIFLDGTYGTQVCYDFSTMEADKNLYLNFNYLTMPFTLVFKNGEQETTKRIIHNTYEILKGSDYAGQTGKNICFRMDGFGNASVFLNTIVLL